MPGRVKNVCAHRSGGGKYMAILQMCKKAPTDEGRQRQAADALHALHQIVKRIAQGRGNQADKSQRHQKDNVDVIAQQEHAHQDDGDGNAEHHG